LINVTMQGSEVHIRPTGRLDADTAAALTRLLACARTMGGEPVLDVGGLAIADRHIARALAGLTPASVA